MNKILWITFVTIYISYVQSAVIDKDEFVTVEDNPYQNVNEIANPDVESARNERILWPYVAESTTKPENEENKTDEKDIKDVKPREKRFLHWSYPQSPIVDMMMQTMSVNYSPNVAGDPFDFLRDSYQLPEGKMLEEYDYIIVGAGTSGSVLAARLTEGKPKATVLLLEAGKPEMLLSDIPALAPYIKLTHYVWPYTMEHQPGVCLGSEEQRCYSPQGKAVGGSSVVNDMIYSRGRPQDWDRIAADGNYGWSYDEILPYYKKSERCELRKYKNATYSGRDGELTVENVPFRTGLVEAFLAAGRLHGNPTIDYNAPDQLGFGYVQTTQNRGHRLSAAKAFLHPHKRRKNLHILTDAKVTKVVIEPQTKRAYAVEYLKNHIKHTARCRREIILAAGSVGSPQLLMLSGIGPKEKLDVLGIPVISDLRVGKSLYDHIAFPGIVFKLNSNNASLQELKVATLPNLMQWLQFGDGLMTTPGLVEAVGFIKTSHSDGQLPDVELLNLGGSIVSDNGGAFRKSLKISDKTYVTAFSGLHGCDTWSAVPILLHPKSKGYLELRDNNPFSHPKLYGNYFTDPQDMETMKEAVKYVIKLGESEPFKKYGAQLYLPPYPNCQNHGPGSDLYWECAIRTMVVSLHHHVGACKMGPPNDPEAIVDPELRVYGVDGLRVVDLSVLPHTISGHMTAPALMIGEKAADMIKKIWSNVVV
ncbi:Glucose dehydrogenase [acceptor] [Papilio machaon]|uniref:Glucose dehydrogenase [acceptor] n=1 Tax=Papilio machaon TaxID=76193 RepID=A0A194R0C6_PAPMA|nr:Glucose dehydrogenase [acceptor] [Papilio machaon]